MKKIKSGIVLLLSMMVFITSSGMAVNLHYCAGDLQNVSFNQNNHNCGMESTTAKENCDLDSKTTSIKEIDNCCQNTHIVAKTDAKISVAKEKDQSLFAKTFTFINHYFISLFNNNQDCEKEKDEGAEISLFPLLKQGLYILLQQFRN
ncbi:HYC_CC_PP family protein [Pedobacter arcticus]|uniref:HYC_CC_PP family protein n=1 Tax=Pedobacter arcticus TaxID=752140 RepID=UPI0002D54A82|nr:hypothetical protein [Pedobacter arcticus]